MNVNEVFGIQRDVLLASYVDRGRLDGRLKDVLGKTHVVIHGDSKQGKSWLRKHVIDQAASLVVSAQPGTNADALIRDAIGQLGVRVEVHRSDRGDVEESVELRATSEIGVGIIAKLKAEVAGRIASRRGTERSFEVPGQGPGSLGWLCKVLKASGRQFVIEDFHYLEQDARRQLAFNLKALSECAVYLVIIGVWPKTEHALLTLYNGDLIGRIEDLCLEWTDDELKAVLVRGATALNLSFDDEFLNALVRDSYGSVGLLQMLALELCRSEKIIDRLASRHLVRLGPAYQAARGAVAAQLGERYSAFADAFVRGQAGNDVDSRAYAGVLRACLAATDDALVRVGIDVRTLAIEVHRRDDHVTEAAVVDVVQRVEAMQRSSGITPPVLAYSSNGQRLFVSDRMLLYYRQHGAPRWPWDA